MNLKSARSGPATASMRAGAPRRTFARWPALTAMVLVPFLAHGCAPAVVGGVAGGAAVVHDSRTTGTVIEDEAIELKIANAIYSNEELNATSHVNATSYNTKVLLTGEAPTEAMRQQIGEIARNTEKVRHVYNELRIAPASSLAARSTDTWITTKVKTQLFRIKGFNPTRVKVVTEHGVVYLMGLLTRREASAVAELTSRVGGIQKVVKLFETIGAAATGSSGTQ